MPQLLNTADFIKELLNQRLPRLPKFDDTNHLNLHSSNNDLSITRLELLKRNKNEESSSEIIEINKINLNDKKDKINLNDKNTNSIINQTNEKENQMLSIENSSVKNENENITKVAISISLKEYHVENQSHVTITEIQIQRTFDFLLYLIKGKKMDIIIGSSKSSDIICNQSFIAKSHLRIFLNFNDSDVNEFTGQNDKSELIGGNIHRIYISNISPESNTTLFYVDNECIKRDREDVLKLNIGSVIRLVGNDTERMEQEVSWEIVDMRIIEIFS